MNAFREKTTDNLGNFWSIFLQSKYTHSPSGVALVRYSGFQRNAYQRFEGKNTITTLQGGYGPVSRGPRRDDIAIKRTLGTNGGGWFGANSAHPLGEINYFRNMLEMVLQAIIPVAMIFALGIYIRKKKFAYVIAGVMTIGMLFVCHNCLRWCGK